MGVTSLISHQNLLTHKPLRPLGLAVRKPNADQELRKLAGEISWYEDRAQQTIKLALQYKLEIGKRLIQAKELLPSGQFLSWARAEFGWSSRHVQNHITLTQNAARVAHLPPGASLRMALAAIKQAQQHIADAGLSPAQPKQIECIHVVGETRDAHIDADRFIEELTRIVNTLGVVRGQWRIRIEQTRASQPAIRRKTVLVTSDSVR